MKVLFFVLSLVLSSSVFAEADIATAKAEMTANLDQRIANLQEAKTCVANAAQREDMKKCHQGLKEDHLEMKSQRLNKREARLKEKMQKVEEKKSK